MGKEYAFCMSHYRARYRSEEISPLYNLKFDYCYKNYAELEGSSQLAKPCLFNVVQTTLN